MNLLGEGEKEVEWAHSGQCLGQGHDQWWHMLNPKTFMDLIHTAAGFFTA